MSLISIHLSALVFLESFPPPFIKIFTILHPIKIALHRKGKLLLNCGVRIKSFRRLELTVLSGKILDQ